MAKEKYIVWIRDSGQWVENGDGPMTKTTAARVVQELRKMFPSTRAKMVTAGELPEVS